MRTRRGFTLVEMLAVVAVLGILATIIIASTTSLLKQGRSKRANAMRVMLEQAIATFYAQTGEWPQEIESAAKQDEDEAVVYFTAKQCDSIFREVIGKGYGKSGDKSMMIDTSGLFVCNASRVGNGGDGCNDNHSDDTKQNYCGGRGCGLGMDFKTAVTRSSKRYVPFENMAFGYAGSQEGHFCRFWITYNRRTDKVSVQSTKGN